MRRQPTISHSLDLADLEQAADGIRCGYRGVVVEQEQVLTRGGGAARVDRLGEVEGFGVVDDVLDPMLAVQVDRHVGDDARGDDDDLHGGVVLLCIRERTASSTNRPVPATLRVPIVGMITETTGSPTTRGCTSLRPGTALGVTVPPPKVAST